MRTWWTMLDLDYALRGRPPAARRCATVDELADWFSLFAIACGSKPR